MLKAIGGMILFVFFFIVFLVLLVGGQVLRMIRRMQRQMRDAAGEHARQYRNETGRQRQQYDRRAQTAGYTNSRWENETVEEDPVEVHTTTQFGETIIDRRGRENKKIFDDGDGEYVEFKEEK